MKQIMKKAILTFALFSLVVLTSFTTSDTGGTGLSSGDTGGTGTATTGGQGTHLGGTKKLDYTPVSSVSTTKLEYSNNSNLNLEVNKKKSDI
jgi:hypothetical protein